jgi:predicted nucleic acid-binding protein
MANEIFADTSGFYAILVKADDRHRAALRILKDAQRRKRGFITTDYVLDETATLLQARGFSHLLEEFFRIVEGSRACRIEWMDAGRFQATKALFLKHSDQGWSFTDCFSFLLMKESRLRDALTKDMHFEHAGFNVLLK